MSHTLCEVYLHLVFSCKNHRPFLRPEWKAELYRYMGGTLRHLGVAPIIIGGSIDHVHILCRIGAESQISAFVRRLKISSSSWIKAKFDQEFSWQGGYGIFSVSKSQLMAVESYVAHQDEHHKHKSFAEEMREIMQALGLADSPDVSMFD